MSERDVVPDGFGPRVRWARKRKGMTQVALGECVGAHAPEVSRLESGRVLPSVMRAARIARCVNMSLDWLAAESDEEYRERQP